MRAILVEQFGVRPAVADVPDPVTADHGVTLRVAATGLCRSDWHGWSEGDRVTVPFVCACGACARIGLDDAPGALAAMSTDSTPGVTVIRPGAGV
jgi:alcohol dehydrogenase